MIEGTKTQRDLIAFKEHSSHGYNRTVGIGYWKAFKQRNTHLICTKRGAKYELDRDRWTTYMNFSDIYDHMYDEMVDTKVASKYNKPMWQDFDGKECLEADVYGYKVTHNLTHPEMCVVMDAVG